MSDTSNSQDDLNVFSDHAMIKSTDIKVLAIVDVPGSYSVKGYSFIKIQSGVYCAKGMYYDASTALFYDDATFSSINGVPVSQTDSAGQVESTA